MRKITGCSKMDIIFRSGTGDTSVQLRRSGISTTCMSLGEASFMRFVQQVAYTFAKDGFVRQVCNVRSLISERAGELMVRGHFHSVHVFFNILIFTALPVFGAKRVCNKAWCVMF